MSDFLAKSTTGKRGHASLGRMDIVCSHITSLELIRLPCFHRLLVQSRHCPVSLPAKMPGSSDLDQATILCPQLNMLTRPIHALVDRDCPRRKSGTVRAHVTHMTLPPGSLVQLATGVRCSSPLLLPVQMAPHITHDELVLLLSELLGTYAIDPTSKTGTASRDRPLVTPEELLEYLDELGSARGVAMVRRALEEAPVGAASPMEAKLFLRATARFASGGYHLGGVTLNDPVELERISVDVPQVSVRKPDLLLLAPTGTPRADTTFRGVAFDYHGGWHTDPSQVKKDTERGNEFLAAGFKNYVLWKENFDDLDYMDAIMAQVRRDLGLPSRKLGHERAEKEHAARQRYQKELARINGTTWSGFPENVRAAGIGSTA